MTKSLNENDVYQPGFFKGIPSQRQFNVLNVQKLKGIRLYMLLENAYFLK